jgi:predicted PurR-regulated permease PerM
VPSRPVARRSPLDAIARAGRFAWAFLGLALALGVVGWLGYRFASIFPPVILATAIVFLLNPFVSRLERMGVRRWMGTGLVYLAVLGVLTAIGIGLYPVVRDQTDDLTDRWPEVRQDIDEWLDDVAADLEDTPLEFDPDELRDSLQVGDDDTDFGDRLDQVTTIGQQVFHVLLILVLAPILAFYVLADLPHIRRSAEALTPPSVRDEATLLSRRLGQAIGGYFRGQLLVAFIVGALCCVGLYVIDLPFWLVIGMFAGLCNMIPLIGPFIGAVPGVVLALATRDVGTAVWVIVIMTVVQQIDNNLISPNVMKRAAKVHPVVVLLSLTLAGSLFGFWGLLVAVPATAVLKIVAGHLWNVYVLGEPYDEYYRRVAGLDLAPGVGPVEDIGPHRGSDRRPDPDGAALADADGTALDDAGADDAGADDAAGDDVDELAGGAVGPELVLGEPLTGPAPAAGEAAAAGRSEPDAEHGTARPSRARRIPLGEGVRHGDRHPVREP